MKDVETRARSLGFTLVAEGPTCWYALLPGETKFRHVEKRDGADELNYIGCFHSKAELLDAMEREVFSLESAARTSGKGSRRSGPFQHPWVTPGPDA